MSQRVPPHNVDAERGVIGAMLLDRRVRESAVVELAAADFYLPDHSHAFDAIRALVADGDTPDAVLTFDRLRRDGRDRPDIATLTGWVADAPTAGTAASYIGIIRADSRRRRQLAWALEAADTLYAGGDPGVLLEDVAGATPSAPAVSWGAVDLADIFDRGVPEVRPEWLVRQDGCRLIYPGKVHQIQGESESGKSWLALIACAHVVRCGRDAAYIDFEDDARTAVERFVALGLDRADLARIVYVRPEEAITDAARARLNATLEGRDVALAVVDGVAEALTLNGWKENEAADVVAFFEALPRWLARLGCSVVLIDHVVKDKEAQDRYARGSGAKLNAIDGATYKVETIAPFGRGRSGRSRVKVVKDRPGWVRREAGANHVVAELVVVSNQDGTEVRPELVTPRISASDEAFRPTGFMEKISRLLEVSSEPLVGNQVRRLVPGKQSAVTKALGCLVAEGYVAVEQGARGAVFHRSVRPFREEEPDPGPGYQEEL